MAILSGREFIESMSHVLVDPTGVALRMTAESAVLCIGTVVGPIPTHAL